ncbi:MAG: response regulator, partial [Pseudomonadota bacterium]
MSGQSAERALVLDDNELARFAIENRLRDAKKDLEINICESLDGAGELLGEAKKDGGPYDFLITDLQFGHATVDDGINTLRDLKQSYPGLKIVAVSGKETDAKSVLQAGAFAFFRKPPYRGLTDTISSWREIERIEKEFDQPAAGQKVFREMARLLTVGISVVDRRMRLLYVNDAQASMSGLSDQASAVGQVCHEIFADGATEHCPGCPVLRVFEDPDGESPTSTQFRGRKPICFRVTAFPLRRSGKVVAAVKMAHDVTSREEFNTFRKALDGDLTLERRMPMVLNAVTSQGYKRVRILLITDDGK